MSTRVDLIIVEERARSWAEDQCEDLEIEGSLVVELGMTPDEAHAFVEDREGELQIYRLHGRRNIRTRIREVMLDAEGDCKLNGVQVSLLGLWGRAYLGFAKEGIDEKIRKVRAQAERAKIKGGKPKLTIAGGAA
jgi:hypothetical protein